MNLSGDAVRDVLTFYKIPPADGLLVVHDEMDLPPGRVKAARGGGSAGHRGIESIREHVRQEFARLRVGIGRLARDPQGGGPGSRDYVLSPFADDELPLVEASLESAVGLIKVWISDGIDAAQRLANRRPPGQRKGRPKGGGPEADGAPGGPEGGGPEAGGAPGGAEGGGS
jgi:PTH1 family peptidyl-tRNA hydrolase